MKEKIEFFEGKENFLGEKGKGNSFVRKQRNFIKEQENSLNAKENENKIEMKKKKRIKMNFFKEKKQFFKGKLSLWKTEKGKGHSLLKNGKKKNYQGKREKEDDNFHKRIETCMFLVFRVDE